MRKKLLNALAAVGLLTGLFAGTLGTASAGPEDAGDGVIFFPWVPNGEMLDGAGPWFGTVTVQNIEAWPVDVTVWNAAGDELSTITLNPRASVTWSAAQLGLAEPGEGVVAGAVWSDPDAVAESPFSPCTTDNSVTATRGSDEGGSDTVDVSPDTPDSASVDGFTAGTDYNITIDGSEITVDWSPAGNEPAAGDDYTITYVDCPDPRIAGVEKQAMDTAPTGAKTNVDHIAVDGYSAVPIFDAIAATGLTDPEAILNAQSRWILPIVQTNSGWNSIVHVTNVSGSNATVNATFYAAAGQGFAGPSTQVISGETLGPGETITVDLKADAGFPDDQVGSLWIDSNVFVVAQANRVKPSTAMALTNVAQPRTDATSIDFNPTEKYAPLVFRDYNGWNTGINIANLSSDNNQVTVTYYNYAGNVAGQETVNVPPRAMEIIYRPATGNLGSAENQITAAVVKGTGAVAASIDEVKYTSGQGEGHAMSYLAQRSQQAAGVETTEGTAGTDLAGRYLYGSVLALPLAQKGNPNSGFGDTSGINLFNPNSGEGVTGFVQFLDSAGVPVAPTVGANDAEQPFELELGPHAGATLYTMFYGEMPAGFQGSAVVGVSCDPALCADGDFFDLELEVGSLVGVSNNVNYEVQGDGSAVYNLVGAYFMEELLDGGQP